MANTLFGIFDAVRRYLERPCSFSCPSGCRLVTKKADFIGTSLEAVDGGGDVRHHRDDMLGSDGMI